MRTPGARGSGVAVLATLFAVLALTLGAAPARPTTAADPPAGTPDLLVTDQASGRILRLDGTRRTWDTAAVRWAFTPLGDARYADMEPARSWKYPSEAKVRTFQGRTYLLTTASYGFAAVVEYPSGRRYWGDTLSRGTSRHNPHSIELLPDGNVAVASSTGNGLRLYAASQGTVDVPFASYPLTDAHGVVWDQARQVLWAVGGDRLVELRVGGTAAQPTLTTLSEIALPTAHGHDLFPVAGRPDRLWVTTGSAVYQYVKSNPGFVRDYAEAAGISRAGVKSVGNDVTTGQVASTVPETGLPQTWWSRRVTVHRPAGQYLLPDGGIYKARWWLP